MICPKEKCTGCYACYNICPRECIEMKECELGHIYPITNTDKCINCKLCEQVCPSNTDVKFNFPKNAYAAWSNDKLDRETSSSGGVASVFSNYMVNRQGIVFGARFDNSLKVQHCYASDLEQVKCFKGSKYVHSLIGKSYKQVKSLLEQNKQVLFIGTPCQIAGLQKFLGESYESLIVVDLI